MSGSSPTPGVTDVRGPVPGTPALQFAPYDLGALGYLEEEFFVSGRAEAFASDNPEVAGAQVSPVDSADYLTRLVVRRPIDPARCNGSVIVEWLNVSGGIDVEPDWALSHRHIIREGFAWVGASVQKAGIDGGGLMEGENHLKALFPERYQTLVHPGDSYSFDMYSQIGRLLRGGDVPLAPLAPDRLIGAGHSQSAAFLVRYINDIDPLAGVFDGFYVHGRGATGARLDGWRIPPRDGAGGEQSGDLMNGVPTPIRDDVRVPVLTLQSETDVVLLGGGRARQPDNDSFRLWEITGSAHAETYLLVASREDTGRESPAELATLLNATEGVSALFPTKVPIASGPQQHYVSHAAFGPSGPLDRGWGATAARRAPGDGRRRRHPRARRARHRPWRYPDAVGRRAGRNPVGPRRSRCRPDELLVRDDRAVRPGDPRRAVPGRSRRLPPALRGVARRRDRTWVPPRGRQARDPGRRRSRVPGLGASSCIATSGGGLVQVGSLRPLHSVAGEGDPMRPAESALAGERGAAGLGPPGPDPSAGQSWRAIRFSVSRRIGLAVVLSVSLALVAGALGISFALQSEDQAHMALTSLLPATATANEILAVLVDQQTGERGYEITA